MGVQEKSGERGGRGKGWKKKTINGWEAREIGEITQQHNAQYFAISKALRVGNPGKGKGARNARCGGRQVWTPAPPSPHLPSPTFANETIHYPQSIHVFLELNHL